MTALNTERMILDNLPAEIAELTYERDKKIEEIYGLDVKIARLQTLYKLAMLGDISKLLPVENG